MRDATPEVVECLALAEIVLCVRFDVDMEHGEPIALGDLAQRAFFKAILLSAYREGASLLSILRLARDAPPRREEWVDGMSALLAQGGAGA